MTPEDRQNRSGDKDAGRIAKEDRRRFAASQHEGVDSPRPRDADA